MSPDFLKQVKCSQSIIEKSFKLRLSYLGIICATVQIPYCQNHALWPVCLINTVDASDHNIYHALIFARASLTLK